MRELFEARSIAVIGASPRPEKVGHVVLRNIIASGYSGELYPVHPKADEILGRKAYPDVMAIPGPVDMAVVVVPSTVVPTVMEQAGEKGVKVAIIISAGFREVGPEGAELERRVGEIASRYGVRVLGPNCLGVISTRNRMNATFTDDFPLSGHVAVTSQSGAMGTILLRLAKDEDRLLAVRLGGQQAGHRRGRPSGLLPRRSRHPGHRHVRGRDAPGAGVHRAGVIHVTVQAHHRPEVRKDVHRGQGRLVPHRGAVR